MRHCCDHEPREHRTSRSPGRGRHSRSRSPEERHGPHQDAGAVIPVGAPQGFPGCRRGHGHGHHGRRGSHSSDRHESHGYGGREPYGPCGFNSTHRHGHREHGHHGRHEHPGHHCHC